MNWQEFEEQLKKQAEGHETPVDTEALWSRVQTRKRRRFVLFFWWLLGAAGLMGGAYWIAARSQQPSALSTSQEEIQQIARTNVNAPDSSSVSINETAPVSNPTLNVPKTTSPKTAGAIRTSQHKNTPSLAGTSPKTVIPKDLPSHLITDAAPSSPQPLNPSTSQPFSTPPPPGNEAIPLLPTYIRLLQSPAADEFVLPESFISPYAPLFAVPAKSGYQVGIQSGISYWNVLHPSGPDAVFPRANERLLEAFHAGAFFQKQMGRRLIIRAGLQYQRYNAVFRWQESSILANQPRQVLNYHGDGHVDTTYIPSGTLVEKTRTVRQYNYVSSWMLPVDFKWRIPARRTTLMPFLGVQAGFQSQSGALLNANGQPDFSRYKSIYKTLFNLGLRTGISTEWRINERNHLLIEPWGSVDLRSRTGRFNPAYEQFWQAGVSVGVVRMMSYE